MTLEEAMIAQSSGWLVRTKDDNEIFKVEGVLKDDYFGKVMLKSVDQAMVRTCLPDDYYCCDAAGRKVEEV